MTARRVSGILCALLAGAAATAQEVPSEFDGTAVLRRADQQNDGTSPVRRIERNDNSQSRGRNDNRGAAEPTFDGSANNVGDVSMNEAHTSLSRFVASDYADGYAALAGAQRLSARTISNRVNRQTRSRPNPLGLTDYLWQWGQFLDHDIDLTDGADPAEPANIAVPAGDRWFDPARTGTVEIAFNRSLYQDLGSPPTREQINEITGWIDASNVYGSSDDRASALRTLDGTGQLKTSSGDLLPFNVDGLSNARGDSAELFVAGDVRANEQAGLAAMHTLFVREHNRLARDLAAENPQLGGDQIYQQARRLVIGMMQAVTYNEFLPALLGPDLMGPYEGYDPGVDARIMNVFSTAAYRLGHSLLSPTLLRLDEQMQEIEQGHLSLADAFFSPARLTEEGGIEPILRGLAAQVCQDYDVFVIDEVRNFLFGPPGAGGFDLASLNIQRGRDHGLAGYNEVRSAFGLARKESFDEVTSDRAVARRLAEAYDSPDNMDVWVGGLAEDPLPDAMVGELVGTIVAEQFQRLRDGDRFWYERMLSRSEQRLVNRSQLADIIRRNTDIGDELGDNDVFRLDDN